jgi:hypothetical protein
MIWYLQKGNAGRPMITPAFRGRQPYARSREIGYQGTAGWDDSQVSGIANYGIRQQQPSEQLKKTKADKTTPAHGRCGRKSYAY